MAVAEHIAEAFTMLGGDPTWAIENARNYSSVEQWKNSQRLQAAVAGGVAMGIPGFHVLAAVADLGILFHKMAYCCWGIGELRGCVVLGKPDFLNILALWSNAVSPEELKNEVVSKIALEGALLKNATAVGGVAITAIVTSLSSQQLVMLASVMSQQAALALCQHVGAAVGQAAMQTVAGGAGVILQKAGVKVSTKTITKAAAGIGSQIGGKIGSKAGTKMSTKIAAKVAAKLSTKTGAKWLAGAIPFVGAAVGAGINSHFVNTIAHSADQYYSLRG